jgi:hypothetical protein
MASILEMIQKNDMIKLLIVAVGIYLFMTYYKRETLENTSEDAPDADVQPTPIEPPQGQAFAQPVADAAQLKAEDLLPKYDDANEFAKQNPVSSLLKESNFLIAGHHVGVNTVVQSNKIPYHDLRSAFPVEKAQVGPWSQSSYDTPAGAGRREFSIGF